jgi:hypothetical protein
MGPGPTSAKRSLALLVACACLVGLTAWASLRACRRPRVESSWDYDRLAAELAPLEYGHYRVERDFLAAGEGIVLPDGHRMHRRVVYAGLYFAHRDDPRPWEEIAARPRGDARRLWKGLVVAQRRPVAGWHAPPHDEEYLEAGPFSLYGDPDELDRIAHSLDIPR